MEEPNGTEQPASPMPNSGLPDKITLTIDFFPATQECLVQGPVDNRGVCYSMLKLAEKAIDERYAEMKKRAVVPVRGNGVGLMERLRRGS